ncbi:uncharacterized protein LOC127135761 [Lathyrus oleraceus]|uniref:uncharacterized protein LOC127135761 n=1 Tax=Pisum sativum TaxID=3888 RepID=UPI0021CE8CD7|nr:uncharacterized protein LOC127135761 [Pisum sativum]
MVKAYELRNPNMLVEDSINPTKVERTATDKELMKFVAFVLKEVNSDVLLDVQTSLVKDPSPDNDSSEKVKENVPDHVSHERISKKKSELVVNVEELTSDEEPLTNIEVKRKTDGLKGTPSRSSTGKYHVGPTRSWIKVTTPTRKRKIVSSSESEFDVAQDVQEITPIKRYANKKPRDARSKAPPDNASLHYMKNAERWKYVIQRRVTLEREFGKDVLKCNKVMKLIEADELMKIVTHFGPCYEN